MQVFYCIKTRIIGYNFTFYMHIFYSFSAGYRSLGELGLKSIQVDPCGDGEAAAEGALLAAFKYQDLKSKKKESPVVTCLTQNDQGSVFVIMYLMCIHFQVQCCCDRCDKWWPNRGRVDG